ncbi:hypothetical protein Tco_0104980 [Tanacetum coccineum]
MLIRGTKREVFGMPIPNDLVTDDIRGKQYYNAYLEKVAKHQRYLAGEDKPRVDVKKLSAKGSGWKSMKDASPCSSGGTTTPVVFRNCYGKLHSFQRFRAKDKIRRTPAIAEPSGLVESWSLYAVAGHNDSGTGSEEESRL